MKSMAIFSGNYHLSPSTLPLDSIRFENVTINKSRKKPVSDPLESSDTPHYTPLSVRIKAAAKASPSLSISSLRVLRATSPTIDGPF